MCLLDGKIVRYKHRDTAGRVTQVLYILDVYIIRWLNSVTQLLYRDKDSASRKSARIYRETSIIVGSLLILKNLFMLSGVYQVMDASGKVGEHVRCVRTALGYCLMQLWLLECSPNFPKASITRYTHS